MPPAEDPGYEYHVFLSYRHLHEWRLWVERLFLPLFAHYLSEEVAGRAGARIFCDVGIESGVAWPDELRSKLARSCVLVPLLSPKYFESDWCIEEFGHMRARELQFKLGQGDHAGGLIVPAVIRGFPERFPAFANRVTPVDFRPYANIKMVENGLKMERFTDVIMDWVHDVTAALSRAPEFTAWNAVLAATTIDGIKKEIPVQRPVVR